MAIIGTIVDFIVSIPGGIVDILFIISILLLIKENIRLRNKVIDMENIVGGRDSVNG
jgi:hypothetical protein